MDAAAYCRNVNPANVLHSEEEQKSRKQGGRNMREEDRIHQVVFLC